MMTQLQAAQIIVAARQLDRFVPMPDDLNSAFWMQRFNSEQIEYEDAYNAVTSTNETTITIQTIIAEVKAATGRTAPQIAADVRSARARGLIARGWSETEPVPADVKAQLLRLRSESRVEASAYGELERA